jgi:hypothetical protein
MMLRIGNRYFDWWTNGLACIEHKPGLVARAARHGGNDMEILEAVVAADMNEAARRLAEDGQLRDDQPGLVIGILSHAASPGDATEIATKLMRRGRVWAEETTGNDLREVLL